MNEFFFGGMRREIDTITGNVLQSSSTFLSGLKKRFFVSEREIQLNFNSSAGSAADATCHPCQINLQRIFCFSRLTKNLSERFTEHHAD